MNAQVFAALNRLCKWRSILAGWHGGSMSKDAPGCQALRDEAELRLLLRAEVNALTTLLMAKGVITAAEWDKSLLKECGQAHVDLERKFPGFRATDIGMEIRDADLARDTTTRLGFPL